MMMFDLFGDYEWKHSRDEKPVNGRYIYVMQGDEVIIKKSNETGAAYLWCYVYMPSAANRKLSLEERVEALEEWFKECSEYTDLGS